MKYSVVVITVHDKTCVCCPTIRMNSRSLEYLSLNNRHERLSTTVSNNRDIDFPISFQQSKYWSLSCCSSSTFTTYSLCSEVALIYFKLSKLFRFFYARTYNCLSKSSIPEINSITIHGKNFRCLSGCKIKEKIVKNSFNFVTTQFTVFNHTETEYEIYSASLEP